MENEIYMEQNLQQQPRIAVFSGSFNPYTIGHARIVERALPLFDRIIIAIGINRNKPVDKESLAARVEAIRSYYINESRVEVATYDNLTVDFARSVNAHWLLKGVRTMADFEYERQMADINRKLSGVETVLLYSEEEYASVSSSMVRELESFGCDVTPYLPKR